MGATVYEEMAGIHSYRGYVQLEPAEDRRRRLHREAAEDVKRLSAALKEAKARYAAYDRAMEE